MLQHTIKGDIMGQNTYTISINLDKNKHQELIEWVKALSNQKDWSLSQICLTALKDYRAVWNKAEEEAKRRAKELEEFMAERRK